MDLWNLRSTFYHPLRRLPLIRLILNKEITNLKVLMDREDLDPLMVLDVGTGSGSSLNIFKKDVTIFGVDRSYKMLLQVRKRRKIIELAGETCRLPFRDRAVHFVSAVGLTEYIENKQIFLQEMKRILYKDGYFLVTISPPGFLNVLRNLLGNLIFPILEQDWEVMASGNGFKYLGKGRSLLQIQYLFRV